MNIRLAPFAFLVASILASSAHPAATAQETKTDSPPKSTNTRSQRRNADAGKQQISRADLASSYLRLEQAYFANPPQGERIAEINRRFDQATISFFGGNNAAAIRTIDELTQSLEEQPASTPHRVAMALKVVVTPPVWRPGSELKPTARIISLYEPSLEQAESVKLQLRLVDSKGESAAEQDLDIKAGPGMPVDISVALDPSASQLHPGVYTIELKPATGGAIAAGRINVIEGISLDERRAANEKRLEALPGDHPELAEAVATCRARNELLSDQPSETNSAQFLADMSELSGEVDREIEAIASGKDPYHRRGGDYWRVVRTDRDPLPVRVYAPQSCTGDQPSPLLIVLHGAGGDENMFLQAYGAGVIKQIADEKNLLIASPLTYKFGDPKSFDKLLEALADDYAIDRSRVYVLGHSMGAGTVTGLARSRAEALAAGCCVAGGRGFQPGGAPLLVAIAELDGVIPAKGIQQGADKAISAGAEIEVRTLAGYGHTLVVGTVLSDAVDWLLRHSRQAKPAN